MKRPDQRKSHRPPNPFLQPEIDAHNAQVEARKAAKLEGKKLAVQQSANFCPESYRGARNGKGWRLDE